ncbi:transcription factor bHLH87-like [Cucumis melo var. makuwa]|uniref:Transcription factor bHLH87-like n=1 Tax=Cucumis melo var. makuwa TaxID=1194695 RepID=A0A5D3BVP3_CUCMM|nr:transcription factor bHLH87-like [Cucumis melo var. makuwa]TYK03801.1 transcription factor bHLH87-like [Cucumis melo var. makuwa]
MEDLLWNSSWSNEEDSGSEESLFVSDVPGRCSSPPLQELQTVARILGLPEIDTRTPEIRVEKLAKDSNVFEREKSCPVEVTTGGVLFEVLENDQGIAPKGGFLDIFENQKLSQQNPIIEKLPSSTNSTTPSPSPSSSSSYIEEIEQVVDQDRFVSQMKQWIYYAAVFKPVNLGLETVEKKRRRNVKVSKEPQTVAARKRREKISEKIRVLRRLVPGGSKMDIASMLDEAASYLKFLRAQIKALEGLNYKFGSTDCLSTCTPFNPTFPTNP